MKFARKEFWCKHLCCRRCWLFYSKETCIRM